MEAKKLFSFIKDRYSELTKNEKRFINSALALVAVKIVNKRKKKRGEKDEVSRIDGK